ncbi:hypothetical protein GCM10027217_40890 [Pseudomaricurvus hydrocarbonicus]
MQPYAGWQHTSAAIAEPAQKLKAFAFETGPPARAMPFSGESDNTDPNSIHTEQTPSPQTTRALLRHRYPQTAGGTTPELTSRAQSLGPQRHSNNSHHSQPLIQ